MRLMQKICKDIYLSISCTSMRISISSPSIQSGYIKCLILKPNNIYLSDLSHHYANFHWCGSGIFHFMFALLSHNLCVTAGVAHLRCTLKLL